MVNGLGKQAVVNHNINCTHNYIKLLWVNFLLLSFTKTITLLKHKGTTDIGEPYYAKF